VVLGLDECFPQPKGALDLIEHVAVLNFTACILLEVVPQVVKLFHAESGVLLKDVHEYLSLLVGSGISLGLLSE